MTIARLRRFAHAWGFVATRWLSLARLLPTGPLTSRGRDAVHDAAVSLGWTPGIARRLPAVPPSALVPADTPVVLSSPDGRDGNVTLDELLVLARLAAALAPRAVFEIGTFDGRTTRTLAENAPAARVVTLDLPAADVARAALPLDPADLAYVQKPTSGARFAGTPCAARITQVYGDSATVDTAPWDGTMDLVFVDGSHAAEYVAADSRTALRLLRPTGGVVVWHDYGTWADVTATLDALAAEDPAFAGLRHVEGTALAVLDRRAPAGG